MDKQEIKERIHHLIVYKEGTEEERKSHTLKLSECFEVPEARRYVKSLIKGHLKDEEIEDEDFIDEIFAEYWGLGILEKYNTDDVDEIIVLGKEILIKKNGKKIRVEEKFNSYDEVEAIMRRCIEFSKKPDLNENNAIVSSSSADGSRLQIVIPTVSEFPVFNIRKFPFVGTTKNMLDEGTFTQRHVEILSPLAQGRANICIIGDPETGKSTTLTWLLSFLDDDLLIATLENDFELHIKKKYPNKLVIPMQEREKYPMNVLFPTVLRQSVDLVIVGEVRKSYEALEYANAATRGLSGSMTTFHDYSATGAINNLASLAMQQGLNIDYISLKYLFARAINIIIKMRKLPKDKYGKERKVCEGIYEIVINEQNMTFEEVPIIKLQIDEDNPVNSNKHIFMNSISDRLKLKLNEYGVKMSDINRAFS